MQGIIYMIEHVPTGRRYIGQTIQGLRKRMQGHLYQPTNTRIHRALVKYGPEDFEVLVLGVFDSIAALNLAEVGGVRDQLRRRGERLPNGAESRALIRER